MFWTQNIPLIPMRFGERESLIVFLFLDTKLFETKYTGNVFADQIHMQWYSYLIESCVSSGYEPIK